MVIGCEEGVELLLAMLPAKLTPLQTDILIDHVLLGRTMDEMAPEYGCSRGNIGLILERARRNVRRVMRARIEELAA